MRWWKGEDKFYRFQKDLKQNQWDRPKVGLECWRRPVEMDLDNFFVGKLSKTGFQEDGFSLEMDTEWPSRSLERDIEQPDHFTMRGTKWLEGMVAPG